MVKGSVVFLPVGMGKTRLVIRNILWGNSSAKKFWNKVFEKTIIVGPKPEIESIWLREILLYAAKKKLLHIPQGDKKKKKPNSEKAIEFEDRIRRSKKRELNTILGQNKIEVPKYITFREMEKHRKRKKKYWFMILDEWHNIRSKKIRDYCESYLEGDNNQPWYIGGKNIKKGVYFVSATPVNPVLEVEGGKGIIESPLDENKFYETFMKGTENALNIIRAFCGVRKRINKDGLGFVEAIDSLKGQGIRLIKHNDIGMSWVLPNKSIEYEREKELDIQHEELKKLTSFLDNEWPYKKEYAYSVGLIRTRRRNKEHVIVNSNKGKNMSCFGLPYRTLFVPDEKRPKNAIKYLLKKHPRIARLLDTLEAEGVIRRNKDDSLELTGKRVMIFCIHQGVCLGLNEVLIEVLKEDRLNGRINNSVRPIKPQYKLKKKVKGYNEEDLRRDFTTGVCCVLLGTDKLSEGFDLHEDCKLLINYELPWSPLRLFQRVGRLTRIKTDSGRVVFNEDVRLRHIIIPGSVEEERVNRLCRRIGILVDQKLLPSEWKIEALFRGLIGDGPSLHLREYL